MWVLSAGLLAAAACSGSTGTPATNGAGGAGGSVVGYTSANAPVASPNLQLASALQPFNACDQLLDYVKRAATDRVGPYGLPGDQRYPIDEPTNAESGTTRRSADGVPGAPPTSAAPPSTVTADAPQPKSSAGASSTPPSGAADSNTTVPQSPAAGSANDAAAPDHSETNVQEKGVDEPDTIKTDGTRILAVSGNRLIAVDVSGASPRTLGTITLPGNGSAQILLAGNHVLALSSDTDYSQTRGGYNQIQPVAATLLSLIDLSDPAAMKILQTVRVDGTLVSARMVDGQARVVTTATRAPLPFVMPSSSTPAAQEAAAKANRQIVADSKIEDWLPSAHIGAGDHPTDVPLLDCAKVSHPKTFSGFGTLAVVSVDVTGTEIKPADAVGILADGQTVYASKSNLYIATPAYVDPPAQPTTGGTTPTTVSPPPVDLRNNTSIHKFDIANKGPAVYKASGTVDGTLLSQFSMSEDDGTLRVATTTSPNGCPRCGGSETGVHTFQENNGELQQVGQVGDMGHGEQVKAVRFVGKQGYVVTYRQTDPLYTLDLSDPKAPRVVGELKLLGYSAYLHPIDGSLLIGIGQDATAQGRALGTKVALYDMADLANPREVQSYVLWNSTSQVEQDFHAFMWWGATKLAMIPVDRAYFGYVNGTCDPSPNAGACAPGSSAPTYIPPFTGAIGLTVDAGGIKELGRVVNPASTRPIYQNPCDTKGDCVITEEPAMPSQPVPTPSTVPCYVPPSAGGTGGSGGVAVPDSSICPGPVPTAAGSPIERSLVVGDTLYTFSTNGLKSSELATLHEKFWLPFS